MLEITPNAVKAIQKVIAEAGNDITGLRIAVSTNGCSGIRYQMSLDTGLLDEDAVIDYDGTKILVDADSSRLLDGATIDFRDDLPEAGFVFDNPNAIGLCSCANGSCSESEGLQ